MENNQPQKLDKKSFIKKILKGIIGAIAICFLFIIFINHGQISLTLILFTLVTIGMFIVVLSIKHFPYARHTILSKFEGPFVNKVLISIIGTILYALFVIFITYGEIPSDLIKPTLAAIGITTIIMLIGFFFSYKYPNAIKSIDFSKVFLVLGIVMIIFGLLLIIIERTIFPYCLVFIPGLYIFYWGLFYKGENTGI
jgi:hypothetical protein